MTFVGALLPSALASPAAPGYWPPPPLLLPYPALLALGAPPAGALLRPAPVARPAPAVHGGAVLRLFEQDWYHRIVLEPSSVALGNLVEPREQVVRVWNAHLSSRTLNAIERAGAEGVAISAGQPQMQLLALGQAEWTLRVTLDGPPIIAATLTWQFDTGQTLPVALSGQRVTAWRWLADWSQPVLERLEWRTDVLTAHDGSERRRALRAAPRRSAEFSFLVEGDARRSLHLLLHGWGARVWARPVWEALTHLRASAAAGTNTLAADTSGGGFAAPGLALLHDGATHTEVVEISAVAPAALTLQRPLNSAWAPGARLYPAHMARLAEAVQLRHEIDPVSSGRVRFDDLEPASLSSAHGLASYRGAPLLLLRHDWSAAADSAFERKLAHFDNHTGRALVEDESGRPALRLGRTHPLPSRATAEGWRRVLAHLRGRHGALWLVADSDDLRAVAPVLAASATLDVAWCGYTLYAQAQPGRRDLRIVTAAGVFLRRVLSSVELDAGRERLTLDASFGQGIALAQIRRISFMHLVRLDADAVEIAWETDTLAHTRAAFRSVPDEL